MAGRNEEKYRCSFCGKSQDQVRKLIAGPNGAYICDECVDICAEIIEEELEGEETGAEAAPEEVPGLSACRGCDTAPSSEKIIRTP